MAKRRANGESSIYEGADGRWHGRVTVGTRDDGKPDRRHVTGKDEKTVKSKVRAIERERDSGTLRKAGESWTVAKWLTHWLENIATPNVRENTASGYRVAVNVHLIPGIGAHRLEKLTPEHVEKLTRRMQQSGSKAATAHQALRTLRTALNEAMRRGHLAKNVASLAKPPRLDEEEVEPYSVEEVQRLLVAAAETPRNGARWAIALALGLRQGEALGLKWADVDLDAGALIVRRSRLRPRWRHGCKAPCGRKMGGHCPDREPLREECAETKSRAGRRRVGLPDQLVSLLRQHKHAQDADRVKAAQLWTDGGWVFATPTGGPLNPRTDYTEWKRLLKAAKLRDGRLHDARHTAATVLLVLEVAERAVMGIMGWSNSAMAKRYQHLTDQVRHDVAKRVGGLLWHPAPEEPR
ncbi:tyrosine-type recombinase/integrase [Couchioplanes azureus]|uniref:tyrosine-type recombinase/integrase n=1 Tax=Couchioplanes caeruleus TaxID=56438 RepID=UPI0016712980|nr:site-specific integrase [Couchioplanes caeruleus]GGQ43999.1 site-specific integrase [Couchioplanes caeruleus subsp. azureus]